jgi:hypothetical protein
VAFVASNSLCEHRHATTAKQIALFASFAHADDGFTGRDLEAPEPAREAPQPLAV